MCGGLGCAGDLGESMFARVYAGVMRALWRGSVSFGLVVFPVRLFGATRDRGVRLHEVHRVDGGRVRHGRVCSVCGEGVELSEVGKGYVLPDGRLVVLGAEDVAGLSAGVERTIEVVRFVGVGEVDPFVVGSGLFRGAGAGGGGVLCGVARCVGAVVAGGGGEGGFAGSGGVGCVAASGWGFGVADVGVAG